MQTLLNKLVFELNESLSIYEVLIHQLFIVYSIKNQKANVTIVEKDLLILIQTDHRKLIEVKEQTILSSLLKF